MTFRKINKPQNFIWLLTASQIQLTRKLSSRRWANSGAISVDVKCVTKEDLGKVQLWVQIHRLPFLSKSRALDMKLEEFARFSGSSLALTWSGGFIVEEEEGTGEGDI
uniref:DUF4283 domain-containing protein n=1 Tax=Cannabis sativa TaxID=3483 RepID=A0A803QJX0_CANSA